jgi:hypothetical protein
MSTEKKNEKWKTFSGDGIRPAHALFDLTGKAARVSACGFFRSKFWKKSAG